MEETPKDDGSSPFRVQGIALVVDKRGKGAHMAFRYPAKSQSNQVEEGLFFSLPPRQVAKLFRPKRDLCGKPMTLSVGGTVFCCCAIMMDSDEEEEEESNLLLFSVVVALAPRFPLSSISVAGWFEGTESISEDAGSTTSQSPEAEQRQRATFRCIRRVHVSLSRLCRILEREERRCRFLSLETERFHLRHAALKLLWERSSTVASAPPKRPEKVVASATNSPISMSSKSIVHRRTQSFGFPDQRTGSNQGSGATVHRSSTSTDMKVPTPVVDQVSFQQELLDIIMADTRSHRDENEGGDDDASENEEQHLPGNLARELVQVYHALARNDDVFAPTAAAILSGRNGIVFVNRHLSVAIEPASARDSSPTVQPYHTLLFPHVTANELLISLLSSGDPNHELAKLLQVVHAQRSLEEMAKEANLDIERAVEWASRLVEQEACWSGPVLEGRLAVSDRWLDQKESLAFSQCFRNELPLAVVVSFVTSNPLQKVLELDGSNAHEAWFKEGLQASWLSRNIEDKEKRPRYLEEWLYRMTVWLYARKVVVPIQECLVGIQQGHGDSNDALYEQLHKEGCLKGCSLAHCSWKTGTEAGVLRSHAQRHPFIRIVLRPFVTEEVSANKQ